MFLVGILTLQERDCHLRVVEHNASPRRLLHRVTTTRAEWYIYYHIDFDVKTMIEVNLF